MAAQRNDYIGLPPGTSRDGIDGASVTFEGKTIPVLRRADKHRRYPGSLKAAFAVLCSSGENEIACIGQAIRHVSETTAFACLDKQAITGQAGDLYQATISRHNNIPGAVYRTPA